MVACFVELFTYMCKCMGVCLENEDLCEATTAFTLHLQSCWIFFCSCVLFSRHNTKEENQLFFVIELLYIQVRLHRNYNYFQIKFNEHFQNLLVEQG